MFCEFLLLDKTEMTALSTESGNEKAEKTTLLETLILLLATTALHFQQPLYYTDARKWTHYF
jgi:hypothetical protein